MLVLSEHTGWLRKLIEGKASLKEFGLSKMQRSHLAVDPDTRETPAVIEIHNWRKVLREVEENLTTDEHNFLDFITKRSKGGRFESGKFRRYYANGELKYDLTKILDEAMQNIFSFVETNNMSRRLYIPVATKFNDPADWPPSVIGIHILNRRVENEVTVHSNITVFTRSTDIDFLRVDIAYFLDLINTIAGVADDVEFSFTLMTSNLYEEIKDEKV